MSKSSKVFKFPNIPNEYWRENEVAYVTKPRGRAGEHRDGEPGVRPSEVSKVLTVGKHVPRVWFFGDSFVQFPDKNIWQHITRRLNCVHAGSGGGGIVKLYHSLMVCKEYMEPEDRVIICYSHPMRDTLAGGYRAKYKVPLIHEPDVPCTVSKSEDDNHMWKEGWETRSSGKFPAGVDPHVHGKVLEDYCSYVADVKWLHGDALRWHAIVSSIESVIIPNLVTPFVARFNCFEDSLNQLSQYPHHRMNIPSSIDELYPLWSFAQQNGVTPEAKYWSTPNHMTEESVSAFLLTYKKELRKLRLDTL